MSRIAGVILAGGRATRMGGGDKGLKLVGGVRLLDRIIARLEPQVARLALNANGDPSRFEGYGLPVLADSLPDYPGPLAGVLAGLDWAASEGFDSIVTAAADTPFFPTDLVEKLESHAGPSGLCLASSYGEDGRLYRQPTFGLWPVALREDLRAALGDGLRKIVLWTDKHAAGQALFGTERGIDPFFNINTPKDIATADKLLEAI